MHARNMAQNNFISDEIDHEATKVRADAHLQKSLPVIGISLKTTQRFITIFWELHSVVLKPICEEFIFPVCKNFQIVRFIMLLTAPAPFDLIIEHYRSKDGYSKGNS